MVINRQSSQPDKNNELTSRQELREAFQSAGAKYRRTPRRSGQDMVSATINVTCHLCQFNFEQPVSRMFGTISCPSCGMRFELKQHYQVDSVQIEQIEQELARLRTEIETNYPQRCTHREKSVIGPLPMQTVKKSFDWSEITKAEKQNKNSDFDAIAGRVRSALVHLENEQVDDYLRWRESFLRRKSQNHEPETIQLEILEDRTPHLRGRRSPAEPSHRRVESEVESVDDGVAPGENGKRAKYADYSQKFRSRTTRRRVRFGVTGMILCAVICTVFFTTIWLGSGTRTQRVSHEPATEGEMLEPSQLIELPRLVRHNAETGKTPQTFQTSAEPVQSGLILPSIEPYFEAGGYEPRESGAMGVAPGMFASWPEVDRDMDHEREIPVSLDRQLQDAQTQLTRVTRQYELSRQNNEKLERKAKQNEAESLLWEAYSHTEKSPVYSMVLALQAIERFKELEIDVPNKVRWVLNQSLVSQNLGVSFNGFQGGVDAMTLSEDGRWFLFAGSDGVVRLWDMTRHDDMEGSFPLDTIPGGVVQLLLTSNLNYGLCLGRDGTIRIWNMRLENPSEERPIDIADVRCHFTRMIVSEDGRWLAAYGKPNPRGNNSEVNDVFLWDMNQLSRSGHLGASIVLKGHAKPIRSLAVSSNSRWLVSGSEDRTVRVYDLKAGYPATEQIVLKGHELAVNSVAISPDGRWLVTGGRDSILRVWDMQNRQSMAAPIELQEHEGWISTLAFSPDGRWLASGSYDNTIRLWRMAGVNRPEVSRVLTGHVSRIMSIEFSRQGNQLVSLGFDREARLWNLEQGDPSENALVFRSGQFPVSSAILTGDGKWLILAQQKPGAAGNSGMRLWPLVFDQAFDFAANFAETRFPAMYQRQQKTDSPILQQQEERIAMAGSFAKSESQFPWISDNPVPHRQYSEPLPDHFPFGMSPVPSLTPQPRPFPPSFDAPFPPSFPPSDGQVHLTGPGTSITLP